MIGKVKEGDTVWVWGGDAPSPIEIVDVIKKNNYDATILVKVAFTNNEVSTQSGFDLFNTAYYTAEECWEAKIREVIFNIDRNETETKRLKQKLCEMENRRDAYFKEKGITRFRIDEKGYYLCDNEQILVVEIVKINDDDTAYGFVYPKINFGELTRAYGGVWYLGGKPKETDKKLPQLIEKWTPEKGPFLVKDTGRYVSEFLGEKRFVYINLIMGGVAYGRVYGFPDSSSDRVWWLDGSPMPLSSPWWTITAKADEKSKVVGKDPVVVSRVIDKPGLYKAVSVDGTERSVLINRSGEVEAEGYVLHNTHYEPGRWLPSGTPVENGLPRIVGEASQYSNKA